jgi:ribose transport system ATP-binding protein
VPERPASHPRSLRLVRILLGFQRKETQMNLDTVPDQAAITSNALETENLTKSFGATVALSEAAVSIAAGSAHALVGENGAGKSTLVKILSGVVRPDSGRIKVFGDEVRIGSPRNAMALGIATVFQELSLVPDLTVAENLFLTAEPTYGGVVVPGKQLRERAADLLEQLHIGEINPEWLASDLTLPEKQMIEIAKGIRKKPRILFLDESTSALGEGQMEWFYSTVERLREQGVTIVFVSHRLAEIEQVCEWVTILRNGKVVGTYRVRDLPRAEMVRLMIGRSMEAAFPPKRPPQERPVALELRDLSYKSAYRNVNLQLRKGEILGVAGLEGQGQRELFLTLFGVLHPDQGQIVIEGKSCSIRSPHDAIRAGIGLVPEDRKTEGLFLNLAVWLNIALPVLSRFAVAGWINRIRERMRVRAVAKEVNIAEGALGLDARSLSGGNQQKAVIGKWVLAESRFLLLYDPTRGVDVGTKFEMYRLIQQLADEGTSVLLYSSELPAVINLADRVVVIYRSCLIAEFSSDQITEEKVMSAAIGHTEEAA